MDGKKEYTLLSVEETRTTTASGNILIFSKSARPNCYLVESTVEDLNGTTLKWFRYSSSTGNGISVYDNSLNPVTNSDVLHKYTYYDFS